MGKAAILILFYTYYVCLPCGEAVRCYTCDDVSNTEQCKSTMQCGIGEKCFIERFGHVPYGKFKLGCIEREHCPSEPSQNFNIIGRDLHRETVPDCRMCCGTDNCHYQLCDFPNSAPTTVSNIPPCTDRENNCPLLNDTVQICIDIQHARAVCKQYCGLCNMRDGGWNVWSYWTACTVSCGHGIASRMRSCNNPTPANEGAQCSGKRTETKSCYPRDCPVHGGWSSWGPWDSCSTNCGIGLTRRHRTCTEPPPSLFGNFCFGDQTESRLCNETKCNTVTPPVTPPSTPRSLCLDTIQNCDVVDKTLKVCSNRDNAIQICKNYCGYCGLADGNWGKWTEWTSCPVSCGNGTKTRSRLCDNPPPKEGGEKCPGQSHETTVCKQRQCPVHGGWSLWMSWADCSTSCGIGLTHRRRECNNPTPSLFGTYCYGDPTEYTLCVARTCAVNGSWGVWGGWSSCSITCGTGIRHRDRNCSNPTPQNGGKFCDGSSQQYDGCENAPCSVPIGIIRLNNHGVINNRSGRVEVFYNGYWGTVCDDWWDNNDATVVCRMLGYKSPSGISYGDSKAQVTQTHYFGAGIGPIWLDDVQCKGNEPVLQRCIQKAVGYQRCNHGEDAGVACS